MSASGVSSRFAVFGVFAALAAGLVALSYPAGPAAVPAAEDLEKLERELVAGARLHPNAPWPHAPGAAVFCAGCHAAPPHPGRDVAAAFRNEHASRMDCLLCHWSAANGPRPPASWHVASGGVAVLGVLSPAAAAQPELERLRAAVTAGRRCFERGPACGACHAAGGMGPLARPGSSPARLAALERLESYFTLAPGEKWYFPQLQ